MTSSHPQTRHLTPGPCYNISLFEKQVTGRREEARQNLICFQWRCVKFARCDHCNQNLRLVLGPEIHKGEPQSRLQIHFKILTCTSLTSLGLSPDCIIQWILGSFSIFKSVWLQNFYNLTFCPLYWKSWMKGLSVFSLLILNDSNS